MKNRSIFNVVVIMAVTLFFSGCSNSATQTSVASSDVVTPSTQSSAQIYLYGEIHDIDSILEKELEIWNTYYHQQGTRHLFVELSYYTAEFLNQWMQSDNDAILDEVFGDFTGTAMDSSDVKEFYKKIKMQCPETVFHGTDVGHQYDTTGKRFLKYLEDNQLEPSEQYRLTQEAIEQGEYYYKHSDDVYRENKMAENFIREFDALSSESVMGIYGSLHIGLNAMDYRTNTVPSMANQLKGRYGDAVHSEDLSSLAKNITPQKVDTIKVAGKDYKASYFGKEDVSKFTKKFAYREFWRLENAYDDFMDKTKTQDVLPWDNYPISIEEKQVFVIDYTKLDGSVMRKYYRSDGNMWNSKPITEEFTVE